ncbi:MAG: tetratricopeptide repeat protein [Chloroflexi bacterium]|nr:tetratricopeptide repeat protein [Chloroflexota bacterium]
MAEISLSAYQDEIERLLQDERYAEAIAHGRHILKSRPKDLRAYRQLGDALIASGRWDEAAGLLRRALGAQPQDFHIHSQLARAYQGLADFERAIWHAERALDQQPSDRETISLIRELYRAHRQEEIDRLQLTAGALAQQQIRGSLLTAALDTLANALERNPNRVDLQLLRARALWLDGQRMDAAETALNVLDRLPYAIDANRIMTELWLAEQRPSDAQTYLKRIEDLDPYLAHQMASADEAPASLVMLERLEYSGDAQRERDLVNPEWLDTLDAGPAEDGETSADGAGGLGALFGIAAEDAEATPRAVTADLDDLLSDEQIEQLFSELVIGEPVAAVSAAQPAEDEAEEALASLEAQGYIEPSATAEPHTIAAPRIDAAFAELGELEAQLSATDDDEVAAAEADSDADLNSELADLLEKLDSGEEDGDWMADIQQASLDLDADEGAQAYLDDFEREWVKAGWEEDAAGAPWLSAAMREAMDQEDDGALNLFGEDEQLQNLLNSASDTEPLHLSDIEDWLSAEPDAPADGADEPLLDIDDELLQAPPARSWLEDGDEAGPSILSAADDEDPNQLNAKLIDDWGAELGDDDDDDPYVDWLKDDPNELDDELSSLAARAEGEATAPNGDGASAAQRARAWGLEDADQLADFVEAASGDNSAPDWLNAVVPGLDRENDAATDDANEYARPMSSPGKEFAWLRELVEEETGEMRAIDPDDEIETPYFRFSKAPAWLTALQERSGESPNEPVSASAAALSLDEDIEALDLDDLTFDDYFSFDTPTDKLDAINLDEDTQRLSFAGLDWDDYFDLESPTEKTIAITLDEDADELEFDPLGVDDVDFDFEKPPHKRQADRAGIDFDDINLGDGLIAQADQEAQAPPTWLKYDGSTDDDRDADDPGRRSGQTTL